MNTDFEQYKEKFKHGESLTKIEMYSFYSRLLDLIELTDAKKLSNEIKDIIDNIKKEIEKAKTNIENELTDAKNFSNETKDSIDNIKKEIEKDKTKIENELADAKKILGNIKDLSSLAGTYSVAKSFKAAKESYDVSTGWQPIIAYSLFIAPLITIVVITLCYKNELITNISIANLISHLPLFLPLAFISFFGLKNLQRKEHLKNSYLHKQTVMETFVAFTDHILKDNTTVTKTQSEFQKVTDKLGEIVKDTVAEDPNKTFKESNGVLDKLFTFLSKKNTTPPTQ